MKRVLYIDGSNLYGGMAELLPPGSYLDFASFLSVIQKDFAYDEVRFYGTYMRNDANQTVLKQLKIKTQIEFFNNVRMCDKVIFIEGHFSRASGKEKGVDVKLAVDLSVSAATDSLDVAMIMTGDADLLYAVQVAKQYNKPIFMGAFASRFPYQMVYLVDKRYVYDYNRYFSDIIIPKSRKKLRNIVVREISDSVKIMSIRKPDVHHIG